METSAPLLDQHGNPLPKHHLLDKEGNVVPKNGERMLSIEQQDLTRKIREAAQANGLR